MFQGGSEHDFQVHDRDTYNLVQQYIPTPGGDFQAEAEVNGVVYASCHCNNFVYTGATAWPGLDNFQRVDRITYILAVDARPGSCSTSSSPQIHSANTEGVWELFADSKGCIWFGGDENQGALINGVRQWLGRLRSVLPARPVSAHVAQRRTVSPRSAGGNQITWSGGTDNVAGNLSYEVLRNDRVISPVLLNTFVYNDTAGQLGDRYFVRTVDAAGNRSATTSVALVSDTVKPTVPTNLGVGRHREPRRSDRVVEHVDRQLRRRGLSHLPQRCALRHGRSASTRACTIQGLPAGNELRSRSRRSTRPGTSRPRPRRHRRADAAGHDEAECSDRPHGGGHREQRRGHGRVEPVDRRRRCRRVTASTATASCGCRPGRRLPPSP